MKFEFYVIAFDDIYGNEELYGVAVGRNTEICWSYDLQNDKGKIEEGMAPISFLDELRKYVDSIREDIYDGKYAYSEERATVAAQLFYENEMKRKERRGEW